MRGAKTATPGQHIVEARRKVAGLVKDAERAEVARLRSIEAVTKLRAELAEARVAVESHESTRLREMTDAYAADSEPALDRAGAKLRQRVADLERECALAEKAAEALRLAAAALAENLAKTGRNAKRMAWEAIQHEIGRQTSEPVRLLLAEAMLLDDLVEGDRPANLPWPARLQSWGVLVQPKAADRDAVLAALGEQPPAAISRRATPALST